MKTGNIYLINLSKLRKQHRLTQKQLAQDLGLSASSIAMYETGARTPSLEMANHIAMYFGVTIDLLLSRTSEACAECATRHLYTKKEPI